MLKKNKYYFLLYIFIVVFFSGCVFDKKNSIVNDSQNTIENSFVFSRLDNVENISQEDATLLGFIFLPSPIVQYMGKKNNDFYLVDSFYAIPLESFESSYQLLKQLYIQDGWVFIEESISSMYINAFFKKMNKEIVVFIQEQEIYNKKDKKKNTQIVLHQSLLCA